MMTQIKLTRERETERRFKLYNWWPQSTNPKTTAYYHIQLFDVSKEKRKYLFKQYWKKIKN